MPLNPQSTNISTVLFALCCGLILMVSCTKEQEHIRTTGLVFLDQHLPDSLLVFTLNEGRSPVPQFAHLRLEFSNMPEDEEGNSFTLLGGGLDQTGFHGPFSTEFSGLGYHFAVLPGEDSPNSVRDNAYKADFTRTVEGGELIFEVFYTPTNINEWGERYFKGCELALTMMRTGTNERVLHAENNIYNWAIAGIGKGNSGVIVVDFEAVRQTFN